MEKYFNEISVFLGVIGGGLAWLLGGWDVLLWTLIAFLVMDYLTGIAKAWNSKTLSSQIGFNGVIKKVMVLALVVTANFLQHLLGENVPLREIVILFFISNEGLSLLENVAVFIDVPEELRKALLQLRDKEEK